MLRLGRLAVVLDIMPLRPGEEHGSTASLLNHGCMIPLLAIKFSARGAPCPVSGLFAPIRLDRVSPPHRDVDAGQSRWGVVLVVVVVIYLFIYSYYVYIKLIMLIIIIIYIYIYNYKCNNNNNFS